MNISKSIKTIEESLATTRKIKTGAQFYFILWGCILCLYFSMHFLAITYFKNYTETFLNWTWVLFPLGGFGSMLNKKSDDKNETAKSHFDRVYFVVFIALSIMYAIVTLISIRFNQHLIIILFPMLIGCAVFITGGITKHSASIIGGALSMPLTIISYNAELNLAYLLAAVAALCACIIPGILMKGANV